MSTEQNWSKQKREMVGNRVCVLERERERERDRERKAKPLPSYQRDTIYFDCPHATAILIIASYVNQNLAFTNCAALAAEFELHRNIKFPMSAEGPVNWYLSVKYDRDATTGDNIGQGRLHVLDSTL